MQIRKIVVASDSFKGSLSSTEVGECCRQAIKNIIPSCVIDVVSVADGGEGTADALVKAWDGLWRDCDAHDPLMRPLKTRYGITPDGSIAIIEVAAASGLTLLTMEERNPMQTSSFGTGEIILHALHSGCKTIIMGLGGSATCDAGIGLLNALGYRFLDIHGKDVPLNGSGLEKLADINVSEVSSMVRETRFILVSDVVNPLYGLSGAAYVFAPQKGASMEMTKRLDAGLRNFSEVLRYNGFPEVCSCLGAGAAGGIGAAMMAFLKSDMRIGIDIILDALDFDNRIVDADLVITGEGKIDKQTLMGKTPFGVLQRAMQKDVPVIAFAGDVLDEEELIKAGFMTIVPIGSKSVSKEDAMNHNVAKNNLYIAVSRTIRNFVNN